MIVLGYMDSTKSKVISLTECIKHDINEDPDTQVKKNGFGALSIIRKASVASAHLEFGFLSESNLGTLRKYMNNRNYPKKIFFAEPGNTTAQYFDHTSVTNPSSTQTAHWLKAAAATSNPTAIKAGTEFSTNNYTSINTDDTNTFEITNTDQAFTNILLGFKVSTWVTLNTDIATARLALKRLTLFLSNLEMFDGSTQGYTISVWDSAATTPAWVEIGRRYYHIAGTVASGYVVQNTFAVRPLDGFTDYGALINSDHDIFFKISNIVARTGTLTTRLNYASLLINGYGCSWVNEDNFTYQEAFTGAGFTGTMELLET